MRKLKTAAKNGSRLEQLKILAYKLAEQIETEDAGAVIAQLSRQYRETIKEIEEIEGEAVADDEIGEILSSRAFEGKPGAVRKNRAAVSGE